jgi:hypothetical protein
MFLILLLVTQMVVFGEIYVSSTQLNRPIENKTSLSPPQKLRFAGSIAFKN